MPAVYHRLGSFCATNVTSRSNLNMQIRSYPLARGRLRYGLGCRRRRLARLPIRLRHHLRLVGTRNATTRVSGRRLTPCRATRRDVVSHRLTDLDTVVKEDTPSVIHPDPDGTYLPNAYRLPPGQLSTVDTSEPLRPEDSYKVHGESVKRQ